MGMRMTLAAAAAAVLVVSFSKAVCLFKWWNKLRKALPPCYISVAVVV